MPSPVSSIRNLGPASDKAFARAGIHSAEEVQALGPDEAYRRLLEAGIRPHFIGYYAMVMGMQGRLWDDCRGAEKIALRARFDAIKAGVAKDGTSRPAFEAALNQFGVVAPQPTSSSPAKK